MRRTPTTPAKAARSADARLAANEEALRAAWQDDRRAGTGTKHQLRVATAWLRSEVTALADEQGQQLLAHVVQLCRDANAQARLTVIPAESVTSR